MSSRRLPRTRPTYSARPMSAAWLLAWSLLAAWRLTGAAASAQAPPERTVADGVYAAAQAARGREGYAVFCGSCHATDLSGTNSGDSGAPPLKREGFMEGSDVSALFTKTQRTMPFDAPGALTAGEYADIVAFILQENGFPAGDQDLPSDAERLRGIRIVRRAD